MTARCCRPSNLVATAGRCGSTRHRRPRLVDSSSLYCRFSTRNSSSFLTSSCSLRRIPELLFPAENTTLNNKDLSFWRHSFGPFYESQAPVIVRQFPHHHHHHKATAAAAIPNWTNLDYLLEKVGAEHICDVEMGGAYNNNNNNKSGGVERFSIPFEYYVDYLRLLALQEESNSNKKSTAASFGSSTTFGNDKDDDSDEQQPPPPLLYLAQNELPAGLRNDVCLPPVCTDPSLLLGLGSGGKLYHTMLWMGPAGTTSPLHTDPLDNFLIQIVGRKQVVLLAPRTNEENVLYTGEKWGQQPNTSAVNVFANDGDDDNQQFPLYETVQQERVVGQLNPGDVLFIPSKWWHAVQSLDFSISVNAWWR